GAVVLATALGAGAGVLIGVRRGLPDLVVIRAMDVLLAFPTILLAILLVTALGRGVYQVAIAVAVSEIPIFVRVARSATLGLARSDFVIAAVALGASDTRIVARHVLPNVLGLIVAQAALATADAIGYVGALS